MDTLNVLDLGDVQAIDKLPGPRKLWTMVMLMAIRDGASHILLSSMDEHAHLAVVVDGQWHELVPPPPSLVPKMGGIILEWGGKGAKPDLFTRLFRGRSPASRTLIDPPWEVRFRLRLGPGLKDVVAEASAIDGGFQLILSLADVTIISRDAETVSKKLFTLRKTSESGGIVPGPGAAE